MDTTTLEHKLTQAEQEFFKVNGEKLQKLELNYYALIGKAKEVQDELTSARATLDQQLSMIVKNNQLPAGRARIQGELLVIEKEKSIQ